MSETLETRTRLEGRNEDLLIALRELMQAIERAGTDEFLRIVLPELLQARRVLAGGAATTPLTKPEGGLR